MNNLNEEIRYVAFNQDCSSICVGSKKGCKLFSLLSLNNLDLIYEFDKEDVCIIERLFSSSLVVLVCMSSPRKLKVLHFKKGTEICSYNYANSILSVKLNRARLVVCLEEALFIHNIKDMKVLHTIRDTPPNPYGIIALTTNYIFSPNFMPTTVNSATNSPTSQNNNISYLAYPGSNSFGEVQIFDTINLRAITMISAHENPVAALSFNDNGNMIATASEKGTVIRIFSTLDGSKLFEFRRGMKRCVTVFSLHFSPDSLFLALSSNTETVHVFKLEDPRLEGQSYPSNLMGMQHRIVNGTPNTPSNNTLRAYNDNSGPIGIKSVATSASSVLNSLVGANTTSTLYDYFNKALSTTTNYLPGQVGEILTQNRSFATAYLPPSISIVQYPGQPSIITSLGVATPLSSKNICAIINPPTPELLGKTDEYAEKYENKYHLLIATYSGTLYVYEFDKYLGGECSFVKSFKFTTSPKVKGTTDLVVSTENYQKRQLPTDYPYVAEINSIEKLNKTEKSHHQIYGNSGSNTNTEALLNTNPTIDKDTLSFPLPGISSAPSPTSFMTAGHSNPPVFSYATALNKNQ